MLDLHLLRIMKHQAEFKRLRWQIPAKVLDGTTEAILADYADYFERWPTHERIDFSIFTPRFKKRHPTMNDETWATFQGVLRLLEEDCDEGTRAGILQDIHEISLGTQVANIALAYEAGTCKDLFGELSTALDRYKVDSGVKGPGAITTDIWDLLNNEIDDQGIRWRLHVLNNSMRPLRPGDFGIVAGRPDKGKTTFLTSEATYMAPQLPAERNVIWLNNEGKGERIIPRLYQSALGVTISEMIAMGRQNLIDTYRAVVGRLDRIKVVDIHGMSNTQVDLILEQNNPGIVIYDMIDHIRGFADSGRDDLRLEEMYKWGRERSVKYDCIGLATSQISNEGDGLMFPTLGMLKDSKTGKQGACDFQLMIGASNDPNLQYSRYIGLPKNKLRREGGPGDPRAEVEYIPHKARYADIVAVEGKAA